MPDDREGIAVDAVFPQNGRRAFLGSSAFPKDILMPRMLHVLLLPLLAAVLAGGNSDKDPEKLEGKWVVTSAKTGNLQTEQLFSGKSLAFVRDTMQFLNAAGEREEVLIFKLRPDRTPKEIDLYPDRDPKKVPLVGIYAVEGGKLKLCWSKNEGRNRPTEFVGNARLRHVFLVLERSR